MKFASLVLFAAGPLSVFVGPLAFAANDPSLGAEVAALEKKLAAARDELAAAKTALVISKSETEAAETRARARAGPDSQVDALRGQVRVLERDLQSATNALKRIAADKAATEAALFTANEQLVATGKAAVPPRGPLPAQPAISTSPDPRLAELQAQLVDVRSRLATAEKTSTAREAELVKLRALLTAAEARSAIPANISEELIALRAQAGAARDVEPRLRALENENAAAIAQMAEMERKLATANATIAQQTKDQEALRNQAARAGELESRLRQVQAERIPSAVSPSPANAGPDDLSRLTAARIEAENKLSTVLRSFTLLTKERDELRARLAEFTKGSGEPEKK